MVGDTLCMKKNLSIALLFLLIVFLYGCPYESPYAIDAAPQQYIDEELLGKWAAFVPRPSDDRHYKEEPVKLIVEKRTDMEYDVSITGYISELKVYHVISNDTIKGTAFISTVAKKEFLNTFINGRYYLSEVVKDKNGFSVFTLSEQFTNKYVKSSAVLRNAIEVHYQYKANPSYDDWFVLKNLQKVN